MAGKPKRTLIKTPAEGHGRKTRSAAVSGNGAGGASGGQSRADGSLRSPGHIPTMQDIADAAGVSQSTVSRVLTGAPNAIPINPATRERILEVARSMRYRPNPLARGLRGAKTMLLGVIVREITDPFWAGCVDAISTEANLRGYNVVLGHAHSKTDEAIALRAILETRHCDAILLLGDTSDQPRLLEELRDSNVPVVAMWQGMSSISGISVIDVDNKSGADALMSHLLELGHRKIAFIGGAFAEGRLIGDIGERRAAYLERASSEGLELQDGFVSDAQNTYAGGYGAFRKTMALPDRPTAVMASTDVLAIGALHAAGELGLAVPGDVSIVGFDDLPIAEYTTPALTTVCMPIAEMAQAGVRSAVDEDSDRESVPLQVLKPAIMIRASSGRLSRQG